MNPGNLVNRVRVHRPADESDSYGDVVQLWPVATEVRIAEVVRSMGGLRDYGPGDQPVAAGKSYARKRVNIQPRDVLFVITGPSQGERWRVMAVFHTRARTDLVLDSFTGVLP